ncbi:Uncharacterized protein BM_BM1640, partial [Brugia malayi]
MKRAWIISKFHIAAFRQDQNRFLPSRGGFHWSSRRINTIFFSK